MCDLHIRALDAVDHTIALWKYNTKDALDKYSETNDDIPITKDIIQPM